MTEKEARKKVKKIKKYYTHLSSYIAVNGFLFLLNMLVSPSVWWFLYPLGGWGIGMFIHTIETFGFFGRGGQGWEERKVQELMGFSATTEELKRLSDRIDNLVTIITSKNLDMIDPDVTKAQEELRNATGRQAIPQQTESGIDAARLNRLLEKLEQIVTSPDFELVEVKRNRQSDKRVTG